MLSASCFFRGNYMNATAARRLLSSLCAVPQVVPEYWNTVEPINVPFSNDKLDDIVAAMAPSPSQAIRSLVFLVRRKAPKYLMSIDLSLAPFQWTTPHNSIKIEDCTIRDSSLAQFLTQTLLPFFPDYAGIPDWTTDKDRYKELKRSYTGREFVEMLAKRSVTAPFGPYGCIADIQWFNYFGKVYVDFIGRKRLMDAGWERVGGIHAW
jgi:hypothetical protein